MFCASNFLKLNISPLEDNEIPHYSFSQHKTENELAHLEM
jgi:hypothetical protein